MFTCWIPGIYPCLYFKAITANTIHSAFCVPCFYETLNPFNLVKSSCCVGLEWSLYWNNKLCLNNMKSHLHPACHIMHPLTIESFGNVWLSCGGHNTVQCRVASLCRLWVWNRRFTLLMTVSQPVPCTRDHIPMLGDCTTVFHVWDLDSLGC